MAVAKMVAGKSFLRVPGTVVSMLIFFLLFILCINNADLKGYLKIPFSLFAASVILLIAQTQTTLEKGKRLLKITEQLGKYTYGLYIYSGFVISIGIQLLAWKNRVLLFITELSCTIIIAAISYHFFESKFLRLKEKFRK